MICKGCGREIPNGSRFCEFCGQLADLNEMPAGQGQSAPVQPNIPAQQNVTIQKEQSAPVQSAQPVQNTPVQQTYQGVQNIQGNNQGNNSNKGAGFSIASMVLGIVALLLSCCFYYISIPCAIIGVILAIISLQNKYAGKGMAIAGLVCSIVSLVPALIVIIAGAGIASWADELTRMGYYL